MATELEILRIKARGSLANNLCPDHRDKQVGKPCLACRIERLEGTLILAERMCSEALPKFNWGASALDANAIQLLNKVPAAIATALIGVER